MILPGVGAPIGGFTRGLLLRLVLRGERVSVGVQGAAGKPAPLSRGPPVSAPPALAAHPALRGRMLLALPHHTRLADLVTQHLSFGEFKRCTNIVIINTENTYTLEEKELKTVTFAYDLNTFHSGIFCTGTGQKCRCCVNFLNLS